MSYLWHSCCTVLPDDALKDEEEVAIVSTGASLNNHPLKNVKIWKGARALGKRGEAAHRLKLVDDMTSKA